MLTIIGLGPGDLSLISLGAMKEIQSGKKLIFRTKEHPACDELKDDYEFESLDRFYENNESFEAVYSNIASYVVEKALEEDVVYAVPGHPRVAESTVEIIENLCSEKNIDVEVIASMSFIDAMYNLLEVDPSNGFSLTDAFQMDGKGSIDTSSDLVITQVYDRFIASNVKLALMEFYDDEQDVYIVRGAGVKAMEFKEKVKLYELDYSDNSFDHLTSLYVPKAENKKYRRIEDLEEVVKALRAENGCPWDKVQTHESLRNYIIEEAYEVADAIDQEDEFMLSEELGDVLLQVVFHSVLGEEEGIFSYRDVIEEVSEKMISRHPHVFADKNIELENYSKLWDEMKREEKDESTVSESISKIPGNFPALLKAFKVLKKAANVGFEWNDMEQVLKKVDEEYKELLDECAEMNIKYIKEELGDLLFSIVNLSRFLKVNPEEALEKATKKFTQRFEIVEKMVLESGNKLEDMSLEDLDRCWKKAKEMLESNKN